MSDPLLWYAFIVLFVLAGCLNLARGLRRKDARRAVNVTLGISSFVWAAAAASMRFAGPVWGYVAGGAAMMVMLYAALLSARTIR